MKKTRDISVFFPYFITVMALIIAAALFCNYFKIEAATKRTGESAGARQNRYLAFDRWLAAAGHRLTIYESGGAEELTKGGEKTALIFSSSFDWAEAGRDGNGKLADYLKNGGNIAVFIDGGYDKALSGFLSKYNVEYRFAPFNSDDVSDNDTAPDNTSTNNISTSNISTNNISLDNISTSNISVDNITETDTDSYAEPYLDTGVYFINTKNKQERNAHIIQEQAGGRLTVTGEPVFMQNYNLEESRAAAARASQSGADGEGAQSGTDAGPLTLRARSGTLLAWNISGALDGDKSGIVMFRSREAAAALTSHLSREDFFSLFFENKAGYLILISVFILIAAAFAVNIPTFGKLEDERVLPGKPLAGRFIMEAAFFKKYGALHVYLAPLAEKLRAEFARKGIRDDGRIIGELSARHGIDPALLAKIFTPGKIKTEELIKLSRLRQTIAADD